MNESCPYPWSTWEALHYKAVFILAGGRVR